jgi:ribosomal protein L11 methyltransferase
VANITADTIKALASDLADAAKPGGLLIASGLIESRQMEVTEHLSRLGFEVVESKSDDEWVMLVMRKVS